MSRTRPPLPRGEGRSTTLEPVRIGLGCVNLGSASSTGSFRDHVRLVQSAIDGGVTVLDTADAYGSGASERIVGRAIRGRRDSVVISTKGGYVFRGRSPLEHRLRCLVAGATRRFGDARPVPGAADGPPVRSTYRQQDFTPVHLRAALERSLRRMQVDCVDVFQLHGPPAADDAIIGELEVFRDAGKVRQFGIGAESVAVAEHWVGTRGVDVVQLPYGVLDPEAGASVLPAARDRGVDVWARGVLGGGVLAAAIARSDSVAGHEKVSLIEGLVRVSTESGIELDELAIRWVTGHPSIATTLLGMTSPEHLHRNLAIARLQPLPQDVLAAIEALAQHR